MKKIFLLIALFGGCLSGVADNNLELPVSGVILPAEEKETNDPAPQVQPAEEAPAAEEVPAAVDADKANEAGKAPAADEGTCDWYLHHYPCRIYIENLPSVVEAFKKCGIGTKDGWVDLTCLTQYFNHESKGGEGPCFAGKQVTGNDIFNYIMKEAAAKE